jgi:flagellar assembly protein FliH
MAKALFRPSELTVLPEKVVIESPTSYPDLAHLAQVEEPLEALDDIEEYSGPTADDLRREAEAFKVHWNEEREILIASAKAEAQDILSKAEEEAARITQRNDEDTQTAKTQAQDEAEKIILDARQKVEQMREEDLKTFEAERKEARDSGREAGREEGFADGKAEVERLVQRTQTMLERAQGKRAEILSEAEQDIIDLVLLISRKVIKVISENQRNVIISNVVQALRKIKTKGDVIIRVNMADVKLTTEHTNDFIKLVEGAKSIQVVEDSTVDSGGCIIETDFGEIDARISSQLAELESKILEISPLKSNIKPGQTAVQKEPPFPYSSLVEPLQETAPPGKDTPLGPPASAALTASAALAAYASLMASAGQNLPAPGGGT